MGDKTNLPEEVKTAIGERPVVQLTLTLDSKQTEWNNPNAPVTVSIPYTPTEEELANHDSIVVWYIDGSGNVVSVPNGRYDPATGTVTFKTTHFSYYAVSYKQVGFKDMERDAWHAKAIAFLAAREIITGTGNGNFSPEANLTRGQFVVMLMKAYSIVPDTDLKDNLQTRVTPGTQATWPRPRNSAYPPAPAINSLGKEITRQEMFTMLYNALKVIGQLPEGDSVKRSPNSATPQTLRPGQRMP